MILYYEMPTFSQKISPKFKNAISITELVVIIAIIAVLATFISISVSIFTQKGRDSKRKEDLKAIKGALEIARLDCNNKSYYPAGSGDIYNRYSEVVAYLKNQKYLDRDAQDPKNKTPDDPTSLGTFAYAYANNSETASKCPEGQSGVEPDSWVLITRLERGVTDPDATNSKQACASAITYSGAPAENPNGEFFYVCANEM